MQFVFPCNPFRIQSEIENPRFWSHWLANCVLIHTDNDSIIFFLNTTIHYDGKNVLGFFFSVNVILNNFKISSEKFQLNQKFKNFTLDEQQGQFYFMTIRNVKNVICDKQIQKCFRNRMGCNEKFVVHHDMIGISDVQYVGRAFHNFLQKYCQIGCFLKN